MIKALYWPRAVIDAWRSETVRLADMTVHVAGMRRERLSVIVGATCAFTAC